MIRDILSDIFSPHSSFGEKCLAAFIPFLVLAVVGLLGLLVFCLVNSVGITPTKTAVTVVEAKQVVPAHSTAIFPIITYHAESYYLDFDIDDKRLEFAVEKEFFDTINTGDKIRVDYGFGRLNGSYEPVKIRFVHDK